MFRSLAVLALTTILTVGTAPATTSPQPIWDASTRAQVLTKAEEELGQYFFTDRIPKLRAAIEAHRSAYLQITDPTKFASAVTAGMYAVAHDKHIGLWYSATYMPDDQKPTPADEVQRTYFEHYINYGYEGVLRLQGNIGYLHLRGFAGMPGAKKTIDGTMALLDHTDALIIDLRGNGGGDPRSLDYLMGYFFSKPTELTSIVWKEHGKTTLHRQFSAASIGGVRYLNKPVYVLIDDRTISCAEQFAYDMKSLHRAQLIGKTTAGGANPGRVYRLTSHFGLFVPLGQAKNPYTGSNWEGIGVSPDVPTTPKGALLDAYRRALKVAKDAFPDATAHRSDLLKDPAKALHESLPMM